MKGDCKKRIVKSGLWAARTLGPILAPHVAATVELFERVMKNFPGILTSHDLRAHVVTSAMTKAKEIGHDAFDEAKAMTKGELERAIRMQIENALVHLRVFQTEPEAIGDVEGAEDDDDGA